MDLNTDIPSETQQNTDENSREDRLKSRCKYVIDVLKLSIQNVYDTGALREEYDTSLKENLRVCALLAVKPEEKPYVNDLVDACNKAISSAAEAVYNAKRGNLDLSVLNVGDTSEALRNAETSARILSKEVPSLVEIYCDKVLYNINLVDTAINRVGNGGRSGYTQQELKTILTDANKFYQIAKKISENSSSPESKVAVLNTSCDLQRIKGYFPRDFIEGGD